MSRDQDGGTALDLTEGRVVVVGAGLAAARLCAVLRRKRFRGRLVVVGAEDVPPYDRPPLSKEVLTGARADTTLPFDCEKLDVDLRLDTRATSLDTTARTLGTTSGSIDYDALAIATGAEPLRLPGSGQQETLRTLQDSLRLRAALVPGARVVIIGASWIGAEVATAAHGRGCRVTCVEYGSEPLSGALGEEVGSATRHWWDGVDLVTGTAVAAVEPDGVHLADGTVIGADLVVTGIGVRPTVSWLAASDVATDRGILTDSRCRTNVPGVVALGDAAQRWSDRTGSHRVVEHWEEAGTAAPVAAASLLSWSEGPGHDPVPYFWSDQFGRKLQYVGAHGPDDAVEVEHGADGSLSQARWTRDGVLTAWLGVDAPHAVVEARASVGAAATTVG